MTIYAILGLISTIYILNELIDITLLIEKLDLFK